MAVTVSGPTVSSTPVEDEQTGKTSHTAVYSDQEGIGASKREGGQTKKCKLFFVNNI